VEALEVGHLRLVASFDEGFVTHLDEFGGTAAEDGLFAEEVGFGFFLKGGLDDAGAGTTDALGPGEGGLGGLTRDILLDGDEGRDALTFDVLRADGATMAMSTFLPGLISL
jgi:hypothetical protein